MCGVCTINAGTVDLYYFPVPSTVSRDLCATAPGPLPSFPTPVASQSVVLNGSTFYADKAYMSFQYLEAWITCGGYTTRVGPSLSGDIIELNSADMSSLRWPNVGLQYPVNFADFNSPVPLSAYEGISFCYFGECVTVGQFPYAPILAVPSAVRNLDPAWANCALAFNGVYDPPYALATEDILGSNSQPSSSAAPAGVPTTAAQPPATSAPPSPQQQAQSAGPTSSNLGNVISTAVLAGFGGGASNQQQQSQQAQQAQQQNTQPPAQNLGDVIASAIGMVAAPPEGSDTDSPFNDQEVPQSGGLQNSVSVTVGSGSNAQTVVFVPAAAASPAAGSLPISVASNGQTAVVGGATLTQGGPPLTSNGAVFVLGSNGLVVSSSGPGGADAPVTIPPGAASSIPTPATVDAGAGGQVAVIAGSTLSAGGPAATIGGTVYSLGPNGLVASSIGSGSPVTIPIPAAQPGSAAGAITISPNGKSAVIGGSTVSQGGPAVTVAGTIYSLGSSGLVVATQAGGPTITIPIPQGGAGGTVIPITTIAGTPAYGEVGSGGSPLVVIGGQTLSVGGPPATISGTVVSLGTAGLVVGGSTTLPVSGTSRPASVSASTSSASSSPSSSSSSSPSSSSSSSSSVTSSSSSSSSTTTTTKKSDGEMLHAPAASFSAVLAFAITVVLVLTAFY